MTFPTFWSLYPRKVGKLAAMKAWAKAVKLDTPENIIAGIEPYKAHKPEWQDYCHPATWLNQGRWMDEYEPEPERQVYVPRCRLCRDEIRGRETAGFHPDCYDIHVSKDFMH